MSYQTKFKTKMNIFARDEKNGNANGFHFVCHRGEIKIFDYLIDVIYKETYDKDKNVILSMLCDQLHKHYHIGYCTAFRAAIHTYLLSYDDRKKEKQTHVFSNQLLLQRMLSLGVNPNILETETTDQEKADKKKVKPYIVDVLQYPNSVNLLKLLLNESKQFEYGVNWVSSILLYKTLFLHCTVSMRCTFCCFFVVGVLFCSKNKIYNRINLSMLVLVEKSLFSLLYYAIRPIWIFYNLF